MVGLTMLVASIGLADSINPSTLVPGLWLAGTPSARGLGSFTAGVFATYLAGGLVLVLGPGQAAIATIHHISGPVGHALLAAGGIIALGFAVALWRGHLSAGEERREHRTEHSRSSAFALGVGIMLVELPTAFVYFGAISAILAARPALPAQIALIVLYNVLFVAPLIALIVARRFAGESAIDWLVDVEARLKRVAQVALTGLAGAGGAALLAIGVTGLLAT